MQKHALQDPSQEAPHRESPWKPSTFVDIYSHVKRCGGQLCRHRGPFRRKRRRTCSEACARPNQLACKGKSGTDFGEVRAMCRGRVVRRQCRTQRMISQTTRPTQPAQPSVGDLPQDRGPDALGGTPRTAGISMLGFPTSNLAISTAAPPNPTHVRDQSVPNRPALCENAAKLHDLI